MRYVGRLVFLMAVLVLGACTATTGPVSPTVSDWRLADVDVGFGPEISRIASGEEFSSNFVWTGDGPGNRKKQVIALFRNAMSRVGREAMTGTRAVDMDITVTEFHALTEFSRFWCCGMHDIQANITVTDAESGEVLASGEDLFLGRLALGGVPALVAMAAGRDQRVRVEEGIVRRTREWLAAL